MSPIRTKIADITLVIEDGDGRQHGKLADLLSMGEERCESCDAQTPLALIDDDGCITGLCLACLAESEDILSFRVTKTYNQAS